MMREESVNIAVSKEISEKEIEDGRVMSRR
jgi:hypothetical protein